MSIVLQSMKSTGLGQGIHKNEEDRYSGQLQVSLRCL
jgi:hypothetical protein